MTPQELSELLDRVEKVAPEVIPGGIVFRSGNTSEWTVPTLSMRSINPYPLHRRDERTCAAVESALTGAIVQRLENTNVISIRHFQDGTHMLLITNIEYVSKTFTGPSLLSALVAALEATQ